MRTLGDAWDVTVKTGQGTFDVTVVGDHAFVTVFERGGRVIDVSDPSEPTHVTDYSPAASPGA